MYFNWLIRWFGIGFLFANDQLRYRCFLFCFAGAVANCFAYYCNLVRELTIYSCKLIHRPKKTQFLFTQRELERALLITKNLSSVEMFLAFCQIKKLITAWSTREKEGKKEDVIWLFRSLINSFDVGTTFFLGKFY